MTTSCVSTKTKAFTVEELGYKTPIHSDAIADYIPKLQEEDKVKLKMIGDTQYMIWAGDDDETE